MRTDSTLTETQRETIIALFEAGYGADVVGHRLQINRYLVRDIYNRWRLRGRYALVAQPTTQRYPYEVKLQAVLRCLAGESKMALAEEYGLASPKTLATWVRVYRAEGAAGLQPKQRGRPPQTAEIGDQEETDVERLQREILYLEAEVAYLKKLRALSAHQQR